MSEKQQGQTEQSQSSSPQSESEPTPEQAEAKYWETFEGRLDAWFDKRIEKMRTTAPSRMGRTSLPSILADLMFGPEKKG